MLEVRMHSTQGARQNTTETSVTAAAAQHELQDDATRIIRHPREAVSPKWQTDGGAVREPERLVENTEAGVRGDAAQAAGGSTSAGVTREGSASPSNATGTWQQPPAEWKFYASSRKKY